VNDKVRYDCVSRRAIHKIPIYQTLNIHHQPQERKTQNELQVYIISNPKTTQIKAKYGYKMN